MMVETNFCQEIQSPQDWLKLLAGLTPILDAAGVPAIGRESSSA